MYIIILHLWKNCTLGTIFLVRSVKAPTKKIPKVHFQILNQLKVFFPLLNQMILW